MHCSTSPWHEWVQMSNSCLWDVTPSLPGLPRITVSVLLLEPWQSPKGLIWVRSNYLPCHYHLPRFVYVLKMPLRHQLRVLEILLDGLYLYLWLYVDSRFTSCKYQSIKYYYYHGFLEMGHVALSGKKWGPAPMFDWVPEGEYAGQGTGWTTFDPGKSCVRQTEKQKALYRNPVETCSTPDCLCRMGLDTVAGHEV